MEFQNTCYLPIPPREWSRVQNRCSLETSDSNNSLVKVPYTNKIVPGSEISFYLAMQNKGNILQYKANSSNLTKNQIYSLAAQGKWLGKTTGVQSTRGYTNPNSTNLKRSGNVYNIAIDPNTGLVLGPTIDPITCLNDFKPVNPALPINAGGGSISEPLIPPPIQPTIGSDIFPPIIPITPIEPIVIQDGGTLICTIKENLCTGRTSQTKSQQICNLTSDSDVPGPIQPLCWNDGTPTWYPRQRYTMTNSGNKWPTNYKGLVSAIRPNPPILAIVIDIESYIEISWTENYCKGFPVTSFNLYVNNQLLKNIPNNKLYTIKINNLLQSSNYIYITSLIDYLESTPSNVIETGYKPDGILPSNKPPTYNTNSVGVNDVVSYYNNLMKNNTIIPINTYLLNYNDNFNNPNDTTIITSDEYNNLCEKLEKLKLNTTDNNSKVINDIIKTYKSIFKTLYLSFNFKNNFKDLKHDLTLYKGDSTILRTPDLLEEFIKILMDSRSKMMDLMGINVEAPLVILSEEYLIYNEKYGIPPNYMYDCALLKQIRKTLN
jgi:hypothetical protein